MSCVVFGLLDIAPKRVDMWCNIWMYVVINQYAAIACIIRKWHSTVTIYVIYHNNRPWCIRTRACSTHCDSSIWIEPGEPWIDFNWLFTCYFFPKKHNHLFALHVIPPHWHDIHNWNPSSYKTISQYHGYWCPGDARSEGISNHDIGLVTPP